MFNLNGSVAIDDSTFTLNAADQGAALYNLGDNGVATQSGPVLPQTTAHISLNNSTLADANLTSEFVSTTNASDGTNTGTQAVDGRNNTVSLTPLPDGLYGSSYQQVLSTGGFGGPYTYTLTAGALPPGLALAASGTVSGTPTQAGSFTFTVTATDNSGDSGSRTYTFVVNPATLTITPTAGQFMAVGTAVPALTYTASGFGNGDTAAVLSGSLGTTATSASALGVYPFTLGTLSAGPNYVLTLAANPPSFAVTNSGGDFIVYTVTSLGDSHVDGQLTLREAVAQATADGLADHITFAPALAGGTVNLTTVGDGSVGPSALVVSTAVTIAGLTGNSGITIARDTNPADYPDGVVPNFRLFLVISTGQLTLEDVTLSDGRALGGNGAGGGGAGLGGAIFNRGTLTVQNSTLADNMAVGGNGGYGGGYWHRFTDGAEVAIGGSGGGLGADANGTSGGNPGGGTGGNAGVWPQITDSSGTPGGFGGGGGGGGFYWIADVIERSVGSSGGFGGGGGGSPDIGYSPGGGPGGFGGGAGGGGYYSGGGGGGGAGLGGAIFNDGGAVALTNSTLAGNLAQGGSGGSGAPNGAGLGGAVFSRNGTLTILDSTLSSNTADQGGRGVCLLGDGDTANATLNNSLLGQNDTTVTDFAAASINGGTATTGGSHNLIGTQVGFTGGFLSLDPPPVFPDSGFETPSVGAGSYAYRPTGSPWTFTGQAGLASNGSGLNNPQAPEGTQVAFVQGTGSISQTVDLAAGTHALSFSAAQRPGNQQTVQVLVDGAVVATVTPSGSAFAPYVTSKFAVTAGSHTIQFVGLNSQGGDNTAFLDQIRLGRPLFLAPLGYYGGPTPTMALLPGSAALDAGDNALVPAGVTTDQVGAPRIYNGTVDIGAYERQATPTVTWADPAAVVYGTALGAAQLDATADVPGSFTYTPDFGTVLHAGSHTLAVTFTPTDTTHYSSVIQTVTLHVLKATPTLTWDNPPDVAIDPSTGEVWVPLQPIFDATANVPGTFDYPLLDQFRDNLGFIPDVWSWAPGRTR